MYNLTFTFQWLHWRRSSRPPPALPDGVERFFIPTPSGSLEILAAIPNPPTPKSPIFFAHGGMGSAWVWLPYLQYFSQRGIPCYALSARGHGESWHPSFLRMVYGTTKRALAEDFVAGIRWVEKRESRQVVLVGHSSGGGLSQLILSEGDVKVEGLVLLGAVPAFGSAGVYMNWAAFDPWSFVRMMFHGWHPNSPVSHPALTKQAFFSDDMPDSAVLEFQKHICAYESLLWPLGMMKPFANARSVLQNIKGWSSGERLLVMAGAGDKLMTYPIMRELTNTYRSALDGLVGDKKIGAKTNEPQPIEGEGAFDDIGSGVRFCIVPRAGHHVQNDVQWRVGAQKLLAFYEQL